MFIKMKETRRGSDDGFNVSQYHAGDIYEVRDEMGMMFVRNGWAIELDSKGNSTDGLTATMDQLNRIFRPQPSRGSAPQNPSTLLAKGEL